jgi:hypothetical protein
MAIGEKYNNDSNVNGLQEREPRRARRQGIKIIPGDIRVFAVHALEK